MVNIGAEGIPKINLGIRFWTTLYSSGQS